MPKRTNKGNTEMSDEMTPLPEMEAKTRTVKPTDELSIHYAMALLAPDTILVRAKQGRKTCGYYLVINGTITVNLEQLKASPDNSIEFVDVMTMPSQFSCGYETFSTMVARLIWAIYEPNKARNPLNPYND
jgi:hypothetical protein